MGDIGSLFSRPIHEVSAFIPLTGEKGVECDFLEVSLVTGM